jgi:serine/threonine-protein kinase
VGGKFLIERRIGAGGMGVVYRGVDSHLGRVVAIKTLPHLAPNEALRLQREARTLAAFSHPNVAAIFAVEVWEGQPLLVLEYLPGGTLADRLQDGPVPLSEAIGLGLAMASVLEALHAKGVLHRDIKPSNIGFAEDGTPKLLDFGLARLLTSVSAARERDAAEPVAPSVGPPGGPGGGERVNLGRLSQSQGVIRGTPLYMSPEAADGHHPDFSFDLWGLAVVLYEAVIGRHPYLGQRMWSIMARGPMGRPGNPDQRASLPPAIAEFFFRALAENKEDRPRTAQEFAAQLRHAALTHEPPDAGRGPGGDYPLGPGADAARPRSG